MNRNEKWFLYITGGLLGAAVFTAVTWFLARASRMPWRSAILLGKLELAGIFVMGLLIITLLLCRERWLAGLCEGCERLADACKARREQLEGGAAHETQD